MPFAPGHGLDLAAESKVEALEQWAAEFFVVHFSHRHLVVGGEQPSKPKTEQPTKPKTDPSGLRPPKNGLMRKGVQISQKGEADANLHKLWIWHFPIAVRMAKRNGVGASYPSFRAAAYENT